MLPGPDFSPKGASAGCADDAVSSAPLTGLVNRAKPGVWQFVRTGQPDLAAFVVS
jgi:hypothetical protein